MTSLSSKTVNTLFVLYTEFLVLVTLLAMFLETHVGSVNGYVSIIIGSLVTFFTSCNNPSDFVFVCGSLPKSVKLKILKEFCVKFLIYGVTKKSLI